LDANLISPLLVENLFWASTFIRKQSTIDQPRKKRIEVN